MNIISEDILLELNNNGFNSQRKLAEQTNYSVGAINSAIKHLSEEKYIDKKGKLTKKAKLLLKNNNPKKAIILAAGFGTRMVPINLTKPKGLIEVNGETLVERLIKQLHEKNIKEIYVVIGFMKEQFEFLIDKYDVKLVVNDEYKTKNNLFSLNMVIDKISNAYIIPCDVYCKDNPFNTSEIYSWYMVKKTKDKSSTVRVNRKNELVEVKNENGNSMIGIAYVNSDTSKAIIDNVKNYCNQKNSNDLFWEDAVINNKKMLLYAKLMDDRSVVEIDTYEQLRDLDYKSPQLKDDSIETIEKCFGVDNRDISDIKVLKKGMTNRSFTFKCKGKQYIMRVPGEGTDQLINRKQEAETYSVIAKKGICDNVVLIDPEKGYKITEFISNLRECNPNSESDLKKCMKRLKQIHEMNLKVNHKFDLLKQIDIYEKLRNRDSIYPDYKTTKKNVVSMKRFTEKYKNEETLAHIDSVPDNFLFSKGSNGKEELYLIDWEYSGMQDPHVDIAMFCIYALYDRKQIDKLIDLYFAGDCSLEIRMKIYCYIAICGLLWSNWCEYKSTFGIEFGEYSLRQYRYAKEYYKIFKEEYLEKANE